MPDEAIRRLEPTLRALHDWFNSTGTPYLIIGGVAVSLLSKPRTTRDVDIVVTIDEEGWAAFLESATTFGFVPRIDDPLGFALRSRVLLLMHESERTRVDVSLGALPFELESIRNAVVVRVGEIELCLPRVEDLIIMKAVASRPIDLADIATLLDFHPDVDRSRIRRLIGEFAAILETPELTERLEGLLAARRATRSPKKKPRREG